MGADDPENNPKPLLADEALTLGEALQAYTAGSAWITGRGPTDPVVDTRDRDARGAGVIEVGAVADLAVTDRDPFARAASAPRMAYVPLTAHGDSRRSSRAARARLTS